MPRFVIHRHELPACCGRASHWDVMLEPAPLSLDEPLSGSLPGLLTWAVERLPAGGELIRARRLSDHRREYLDYEGPVSGNRGSVRRWDAGRLVWLTQSEDFMQARVLGSRWVGVIRLRREALERSSGGSVTKSPESTQRWLLEFTDDD